VKNNVTARPTAASNAVIHLLDLGIKRSTSRSTQDQAIRMVSGKMVK
jgi:hypothetical protein